ncbi:hypothetical protein C0J52_19265 [Blattella germanica]|nr:hypothetical protein C0J52_19265 [Blattella germanica]
MRPVPSHNTTRRLAKRFKETGSINKPKSNMKRRVLTEEKLDEICEKLEHTPQKSLRCLGQESGISASSARKATKLLKLKPYKIRR